jgi:hypothetical protein
VTSSAAWCTTAAVAKKPKKRKTPRPTIPGVAQKLIKRLNRIRDTKIVDLAVFRQARETALQQRAQATEGLEDFHPLHAAYTYVVKTVVDAANHLGELPELAKLMAQIAATEEEYMPSGPPMSPITRSYFLNWTLFDLTTGPKSESLGDCVLAVVRTLGSDPSYVEFVEQLCRTRPGLYVHQGRDGDAILLRELVTEAQFTTLVPSGYEGRQGDLLLMRLLPPFLPGSPLALAMTTPYQIIGPVQAAWQAYFDRTLPKLGPTDKVVAYESLMKRGAPPHGPRYWTEYIFEAYANHRTEVVFLTGLPDVDESRPHSKVNGRLV